jgi:hypothetical protein
VVWRGTTAAAGVYATPTRPDPPVRLSA